jgi:hypothetical protein
MCYDERWLWWRRHREAEDSESMWRDFERTRPIADTEPAPEDTPVEPTAGEVVSER